MTYAECFLDSARGVYIPQNFAESINPADWTGITPEDLDILRAGPEHEFYWDAWTSVLDYAETKDGRVLHQDGDLWLVARDKAIEDLDAYFAEVLDYETHHGDAGDAYAHLVEDVDLQDVKRQLAEESMVKAEDLDAYFAEVLDYETHHGDAGDAYAHLVEDVDLQDVKRQLAEESMVKAEDGTGDSLGYKWVKKLDLDLRGLNAEDVARLALGVFQMVPGSIYGPFKGGLVLASFAVQEIETEVPEDFDGIVLDFIGDNSTDAYIPEGGRLAYIATDAAWYALASVKDLQDAIDAEVLADA